MTHFLSNRTTFEDEVQSDPILDVYNLHTLSDVVLTADIDWAPEFCIEYLFEAVASRNLKMTVFATHESSLLKNPPSCIEVGIHPDFTREKADVAGRIAALRDMYPHAMGSRSHRNVFGQNVSDALSASGFTYDVSTFLWNCTHSKAHLDYNGLVRFWYMWEDGIQLDTNTALRWDEISLNSPGLKILNVHPVLIYLNCISEDARRQVTKNYSDLTTALKKDFDSARFQGFGIGSYWLELLTSVQSNRIQTHHLGVLAKKFLVR